MDPALEGDPMPTFLVERYWPGVDLAILRDALVRLDAEAESMTADGTRIEHVASILMPVDQVVFSLIEAADESLVRQLNDRLDLPADRIASAIAIVPERDTDTSGPARSRIDGVDRRPG